MILPKGVNDRLIAAVDLVGRSGAREFESGYLHDDVPIEEAGWWASALYKGAKIMVEDQPDPIVAAEALAERLLTGSMCNHCEKLVALSDEGAFAYFNAHLVDGRSWNAAEIAERGQCRWRRIGDRWVRGCEPVGANRAQRRAKRRR